MRSMRQIYPALNPERVTNERSSVAVSWPSSCLVATGALSCFHLFERCEGVFLPHGSPSVHHAPLLTPTITFGRWVSCGSCSQVDIRHTSPKQRPGSGAVPGPFDSLAQPSRATCEHRENAGIQRELVHPARRLSCRLCRSWWELAARRSRVRVGLQPGAMLEEVRLL